MSEINPNTLSWETPCQSSMNCAEVAERPDGRVALRSTNDPDTVLTLTRAEWKDLTNAIKAGRFDFSETTTSD